MTAHASGGRQRAWTLAVIAGTVCVILVSLLGLMELREVRAENALRSSIEQSHGRQRLVSNYLGLLQDIETGQRGYLVTGNAEFRQPFDHAMARLDRSEQQVRKTFADGDPARPGALRLIQVGRERAMHAARNIQLWDQGSQGAALAGVRSGDGKRLMDRARALAAELVAHEDRVVRRKLLTGSEAAAGRQRTVHLGQIGLLFALLVLVTGLFRTVRGLEASAVQLNDSATRQTAIFENATDAMMMLDSEGRIETMNWAAESLFGRTRAEMTGVSNLALFADPPSAEVSRAYLERLADGDGSKHSTQDFVGLRGDGTHVDAEVVTTPIRLEDGLHFLAIARDATERRRTERLKSEFVATVSHELRTPLTSINGSLGLLSGGAAGELPTKALRLVEIAHSNSERLIRLINDILDMEKIESGKLSFDLRPLQLCHLLDQAVQANQTFASRHQVGLALEECPPDWQVLADQDRFMQVMTNLLSNAVKFSPTDGRVGVAAVRDGARMRISVSDQGPGIDEEFRSRIFTKFAQADSTDTRQKGGTGLGLSIVQQLVAGMGGTVTFDSKLGEGTVFHIDLPAVDSAAEPADFEGKVERLSGSGLPQLLHVDDDPDTLRLVASAFEGRAEVHSTPSVAEARASLQRYEFDAVILDLAMSDGSGLDLVPLVRAGERRIPIILFTALDEEPDAHPGVDAYLTKSKSDLGAVVATVERLVGQEMGG